MDSYEGLIEGYQAFRTKYLDKEFEAYRTWAGKTQKPKVMVIGCSDSRVNPAILTYAGLGEIFAVNNVANIVPPFVEGRHDHYSVGAAVQYAVTVLEVEHIIVMAHSGCGGIRALMSQPSAEAPLVDDYISGWVQVVADAKTAVEDGMDFASFEEKCQVCEMEAALVSVSNLMSFPYVDEALNNGRLDLHAWYFIIESGELLSYNFDEGQYRRLIRPNS
ncbi:carbonic anhydrase [Kordiimonas sediminis]|uniref:carbonic anhydrase n=1 Tax=Kordiimonas sediminis TaxID=1735581 RepID=A0A919ARC4_9PROT|nr:carbonic anhydrase [Kordiimonas sediminis]GHF22274.1 carbonic anhydrase [Kordiimonas sediminis]